MDNIRIPVNSGILKNALNTGCLDGVDGWVAQKKEENDVIFQHVQDVKPSVFYRLFKATRAISLTATLLPSIAAVLLCYSMGLSIDAFTLVTAVIGVLLLQVSVNAFNDVEDYLKLIDLPGSLGGSGVIQSGWFSAKQMNMVAWCALFLAFIFALPAVFQYPLYILVIGMFAGVGVVGYSGKPFRFKYRALGDVFVFLLCGPILTLGVGLSASGTMAPLLLLLGAYFGFIACGILNANNLNDIKVDAASGAKTLASVLGFANARWLQVLYYVAAFVCLSILAVSLGVWLLLPIVTLPVLVRHIVLLFKADSCDQVSLNGIRFDAAKLHLLLSVSACIGLFLSL
ncbi:prenyltransferase [Pseudomonas sp. HK3]